MTHRHTIDTNATQTREPRTGTVSREGGGSLHPTLGGGSLGLPDTFRCVVAGGGGSR
jgi:hypothetical protein